MEKSREAFRTISEVAEWLDVPTHVLRFWESRFSQIKPVKRAGGRRYYRPSDMRVIGGVKTLLHDQGMTIRGVQKLFREQGVRHVSSFSPRLFGKSGEEIPDEADVIEASTEPAHRESPAPIARATRDAEPAPVVELEEAEPSAEEESVPEEMALADASSDREAPTEDDEASAKPSGDLAVAELESEVSARSLHPTDEPDTSADEGLVFIRRRSSDDAGAPSRQAEPELVHETEVEQPSAPAIPPTPDVPETDPADDDPSHPNAPGIAVRLLVARRAQLKPDRDTVSEVYSRLKDLRGRLG